MNHSWFGLLLLAGLSLSQVPVSKNPAEALVPGALYELTAESPTPVHAEIRQSHRLLFAKALHEFDPRLRTYWRADAGERPVSNLPLRFTRAPEPDATPAGHSPTTAVPLQLDREYHVLAGDLPLWQAKPEDSIQWFTVTPTGPQPLLTFLEVRVEDRELPSDILVMEQDTDGKLIPYRNGSFAYRPEATQTLPGLASFRTALLQPGKQYWLRVLPNHEEYRLRLKTYPRTRSPKDSVEMGMDFLATLGASWHANAPRRGAVASRANTPHVETQSCIACHPTVFATRAFEKGLEHGLGDPKHFGYKMLRTRLQENARPFPGHPGVTWVRTIFSARAASARTLAWNPNALNYLRLTSLELGEEADGAPPNVSPLEIAYYRLLAAKEPEVARFIETKTPENVVDLSWKILGLAQLGKDTSAAVRALFAVQREDGLFPYHLDKSEAGSEYITWHALWALAEAGYHLQDPRIARLEALCRMRQAPWGGWQGTPTHKAFDTPFRDTQFAVMALSVLHGKGPAREKFVPAPAQTRHLSLPPTTPKLRVANQILKFYVQHPDEPELARQALTLLVTGAATEQNPAIRATYQQALYGAMDENEGYLEAWKAPLQREEDRLRVDAAVAERRKRLQAALAAGLRDADRAGKAALLQSMWDHPQRHAGMPKDLNYRAEVVLPAYFSEYQDAVPQLHVARYEPWVENSGFRYAASNSFYKTRVGNDSDLPDLGEVSQEFEHELLACLTSQDREVALSAVKALSAFPRGTTPALTLQLVTLLPGHLGAAVRDVFADGARADLRLAVPHDWEERMADALLAALRIEYPAALETLLPALARLTPGEGLTRHPRLQGRIERLLLDGKGVRLDLALAAAAVFPHIADGPLIRTMMLEAFNSHDRDLQSAAVEIFVKSYIAEPTNPVLGKQFAEKATGDIRRRMLDALDPARFSLRLSALNRYNPGRLVELPEDANLFSSEVARKVVELGIADRDPQVRRAAEELVHLYPELARFRPPTQPPAPPLPDLDYFRERVLPILTKAGPDGRACVVCHATQGGFALRMPGKAGYTSAQIAFNYRAALAKVNVEEPKRSLLLLKPTRPNDNAGDPALHTATHGGGTRWGKDTRAATASEEYEVLLRWIRGARL